MEFLTDLIAPSLAVLASAVGLIVALEQLTAIARLRRQSAYWREELESSTLRQDRAIMRSLHREAAAQVAALQAVPGKRLVLPALEVLAGLAVTAYGGYLIGDLPPNDMTWARIWPLLNDPPAILAPVLIVFGLVMSASVVLERKRISKAFLDGDDLTLRMDPTLNINLKWAGWLQLVALGIGLWSLAAAFGLASGVGASDSQYAPWWLFVVVAIGVVGTAVGSTTLIRLHANSRETWRHPRAMTPKADIAAPSATAGVRRPPHRPFRNRSMGRISNGLRRQRP